MALTALITIALRFLLPPTQPVPPRPDGSIILIHPASEARQVFSTLANGNHTQVSLAILVLEMFYRIVNAFAPYFGRRPEFPPDHHEYKRTLDLAALPLKIRPSKPGPAQTGRGPAPVVAVGDSSG